MAGVLIGSEAPPRPARVAPRHRAGRRGRAEAAGLAVALTMALVAVAHLALSDRAWVLFSDGDSVLPALIHASLSAGERQDWALSSVLFAPEFVLYSVLAVLGLGVRGTLALNGVVDLVLLYGALRVLAALVRPTAGRGTQIAGALLGAAVFDGLTLLDSSAAWDSLELPSLLATTTYYSATVLATVVAVGLVAALLAGPRRPALGAGLLVLAAGSTWTNPLFVAWAVVPLALVAAGLTAVRTVPLPVTARVLGLLAAGVVLGLAARLPFAALLARGPADYAHPADALPAVGYTLRLLVERCATGAGAASLLAAVALQGTAAVLAVRRRSAGRTASAAVAAFGVVAPVTAVLGTIALGAPASRYLQPIFFAPLLVLPLLTLPARLRPPAGRAARSTAIALGASVALVSAGAVAAVAARPDSDIRCVDSWITASGRTGAGLFQTIRGPKAYLPDPRRLVQVDETLRAQPWLTNRADYDVARVSFLVTDGGSPAIAVPSSAPVPSTVTCGRYRILDFGAAVLPVLPAGRIAPPKPPPRATVG